MIALLAVGLLFICLHDYRHVYYYMEVEYQHFGSSLMMKFKSETAPAAQSVRARGRRRAGSFGCKWGVLVAGQVLQSTDVPLSKVPNLAFAWTQLRQAPATNI